MPKKKVKPIKLQGRPGYWVALDPVQQRLVAEGRTLRAAATQAAKAGVQNPVFTQLPKESCALVM